MRMPHQPTATLSPSLAHSIVVVIVPFLFATFPPWPFRPFTTSRTFPALLLRNPSRLLYSLRSLFLCLRSFLPLSFLPPLKHQVLPYLSHLIAILFLSSDFLRVAILRLLFFLFYCFFYLHIQRYHNYIDYGDLDKQKHPIHIALLYLSFFSYLTMSSAFLPSSFLGNRSSFLSSDFLHSMIIVPLLRSLFLAEIYNTSCSSSNKKIMTCYILSIYREVLSINDRYKFYLVTRTFIIFSLHHVQRNKFSFN